MYSIIKSFPQHLQEAIVVIKNTTLKLIPKPIHNIVITGMGSSGLAGELVKQWVLDKLPIPLIVNHDYNLPAYINEHTLLIVVSYSGNTQETIEAFQTGVKQQANIIIITSGGKLLKMAHEQQINVLSLPKYLPPRACIDYTLVQILFILYFYRILSWKFLPELKTAIQLINDEQTKLQAEAEEIASKISDKISVIYTSTSYEAVAMRLRQQLNENSKQLCWHHVYPELCHNEIVGWESHYQNLATIILTGHLDDEKLKRQQEIILDILRKQTDNIIILNAQGPTHLVRSLYLVHLSDWISLYLAERKGVNPMEIKSIDQIKSALYANS